MPKFDRTLLATLFLSVAISFSVQAMEPPEPDDYTLEQIVELKKAAEQGDKVAQFRMGYAYHYGLAGLMADATKAMEWYQKSSAQGYAKATHNIGILYNDEDNEILDYTKAKEMYESTLQQDPTNYIAKYYLAQLYLDGLGVKQDVPKALILFKEAAQSGDKNAPVTLGQLYTNDDNDTSYGIKKDVAEGIKWYQKGVDNGSSLAMVDLAYHYYSGEGVDKDLKKAFDLYTKASEEDHEESATYMVAYMYQYGEGVDKNLKKAFDLYSQLAEEGYSPAQNNLGYMYMNGESVPQDLKLAFEWYSKSAEQENPTALYNLADMYRDGYYVKKDTEKAIEYYDHACQLGDEDSCEEHKKLATSIKLTIPKKKKK
ncbi:MAG TPA: hypothetical protein DD638_04815 [Pasteurellaceae bacterium]|nr:hypothetical protein [Pasteurellaceae bacterium]